MPTRREISLKFKVSDDGTLSVFDDAETKMRKMERTANEFSGSATGAFGSVGAEVKRLTGLLAGLGVAAAAVKTAGFIGAQLGEVDKLQKLSDQLGVTSRELSSFRVAAEQSGVGLDKFGEGLTILSRHIGEATAGTGEARGAFSALGIQLTETDGRMRSSTSVMTELADIFQALGPSTERTAIAQRVFGESGAAMIPLLRGGSQALADQRREAERLGLVFDEDMGRSVERANDAVSTLRLSAQGLAQGLAIALAPSVTQVAGAASDWVVENRKLIENTSEEFFRDLPGRLETAAHWMSSTADAASELASFADRLAPIFRFIGNNPGAVGGAVLGGYSGGPLGAAFGASAGGAYDYFSGGDDARSARGTTTTRSSRDIVDAIRNTRRNLGLDDSPRGAPVLDLDAIREAFNVTGTQGGGRSPAAGIRAVNNEIERMRKIVPEVLQPLREFGAELDNTTTISIDLGDSFRRLGTGGGDFDFLDALKDATRTAGADMFDAILGDKLKFDIEMERNFAEDLPSFFQSGMDSILGIFRGTTDELGRESQRGAGSIATSFADTFKGIASGGQALSHSLSGFGFVQQQAAAGVPTGLAFDSLGNVVGGFSPASGANASVDPSLIGGGGSVAGAGLSSAAGIVGGGVVLGAVQLGTQLAGYLDAEEEVVLGRLRTTRPAGIGGSEIGSLAGSGALIGAGTGVALGVAGGASLGASIGSVVPLIGTAIGAVVGAPERVNDFETAIM